MAGTVANLTGETEEGLCIRDFQKLDPHFDKEEWAKEVKAELVPVIIKAHLNGNINAHKHILGEAVQQLYCVKNKQGEIIEVSGSVNVYMCVCFPNGINYIYT